MHAILLILLAVSASAITVSYELSPEIVLPNGYADCVIKITNNQNSYVDVNSISFYSVSVEVFPSSIAVGKIGPNSVYTAKVSMKSSFVGRQIVEMLVSYDNYTISQPIELIVDDRFPQIAVASPVYLGEVNDLKLIISSPVTLKDLRVEALFNATPRVAHIGILSGSAEVNFKFFGEKEDLRFRISFYNGRSYHEVERTPKIFYLQSKGVLFNLQISKSVVYFGEAAEISLEVFNLRNDDIYDLEIQPSGKGKFNPEVGKVEKLGSGEKRVLKFLFSPRESEEVYFLIRYKDYFGREYEALEKASIMVLEKEALQFANIRKEAIYGKFRISGEIINYGHRKAMNVLVSVICNESKNNYFIGEVKANDYETFDLEADCIDYIKLSWWNELGESFSVSEKIKDDRAEISKKDNPMPIFVSAFSATAIIVLIILIIRHRKK
uniref:S-layer protein n=1 Tax=Archaeoglobus fulgidus TaxID=2234 RepID=A0A7J2TJM2_ARCFL